MEDESAFWIIYGLIVISLISGFVCSWGVYDFFSSLFFSQSSDLIEWLKFLFNYQCAALALFFSLSIVIIRLSSSTYSVRILDSITDLIFRPKFFSGKNVLLFGLLVYILAMIANILLQLFLPIGISPIEISPSYWQGICTDWIISFILIYCLLSFVSLVLCFLFIFHMTQSDNIIKMSLDKISVKDSDSGNNVSNKKIKTIKNKIGIKKTDMDNGDNNKKHLQLIFNVINSSIQHSDALSSETGITLLSEKVKDMALTDKDIVRNYITQLTNSGKKAHIQGDETTACLILDSLEETIVSSYKNIQNEEELMEIFLSHIELIINSYANLSQFSIEKGHIDSASKSVEKLQVCSERLISCCKSCFGEPDSEQSENLKIKAYDLTKMCIKSISIASQIAAQRNYESFVQFSAELMQKMCETLCDNFKSLPHVKEQTDVENNFRSADLINHYIWSIKDAGVSASDNDLERAAIEYIQCLELFGESILQKSDNNYASIDKQDLAKSMTHICASIREIGQKLAEKKLQMGTIKSIDAINCLAKKVFPKKMCYKDKEREIEKEKLSFIRITWNLKDIGLSAAGNGIEKAIVRAIEGLFDLFHLSINQKWDDEEKKTKALIRIGEGFYEIIRKTKSQGLHEALSKITYYNLFCICLIQKKNSDHRISDIFLKNVTELVKDEKNSEYAIKVLLNSKQSESMRKSLNIEESIKENVLKIVSAKLC